MPINGPRTRDGSRGRQMHSDKLLLTTQPGWAFATLAELRSRGVTGYIPFYHRDSSIIAPGSDSLLSNRLMTPADVFVCLLQTEATASRDAVQVLSQSLNHSTLKERVLSWLSLTQNTHPRRYSVVTETYGSTSWRRKELSRMLSETVQHAFPRWKRASRQGARFYCKADPQVAVLGLQLYSNLSSTGEGRPGSLRDHLAYGLLTLANLRPHNVVFDPFMGTGRILQAARHGFGIGKCIGLEIDLEAYLRAKQSLDDPGFSLFNVSFEDFNVGVLSETTKLVSNVPFGERFTRVHTERLMKFLRDSRFLSSQITLLMSRAQAKEMASPLGSKVKNVLVLGQPASILYTPSQDPPQRTQRY